MKKRAILIDGNNLLFRSYYATAYTGNIMRNSKGFPTNGLYGFINMLNKILKEENPEYIMVAFDKGKNFRQDLYKEYKDGRSETPEELKMQFPIAKEICSLLGIKYIECDNYEADDIIGTFARMADEDKLYNATIISSDKDLLQLITDEVTVKLLKQKDYIFMDEKTFKEQYGINPIKMIDLKALMGDPSDNIPGVKGIGEKTALNLLQEYDSLDNIYQNIENIKGKLKEKLIGGKDDAYFSYKIATIYKTIDFDYTFEDIKYGQVNTEKLIELYKELEFNNFLKNIPVSNNQNNSNSETTAYIKVEEKLNINFDNASLYIQLDSPNYHTANLVGASIYDGKNAYYFDLPAILINKELFKNINITYDLKKNIIALNKLGIKTNSIFDTQIAAYLLNYITKDDINNLALVFNENIPHFDTMFGKKSDYTSEDIIKIICKKSKFIYDINNTLKEELQKEQLEDLYTNIEHPLIYVLTDMELTGIDFDLNIINELKEEIKVKMEISEHNIYNYAGEDFNLSSPKQLANILYEKLNLPRGKGKNKNSTAHESLLKLRKYHPIIEEIITYRELSKLYGTYLESYEKFVLSDGKIHTMYKQIGARTGRISSVDPNLQNIPVRSELGRKIRKAFLPSKDSYLLSSDYSQIELRLLAHVSSCPKLSYAFNNDIDVHTQVASDIFSVPEENVTKDQRRTAKAVIFGIVYGISGYGLGENLEIEFVQARKYINKYLEMYPGVDNYMKNIVEETRKTGFVRTIMNRKRIVEEIKNENKTIRAIGDRIALNTPMQGSSADIIKLAMINIHKELKNRNLKTKLLLQVHDELILNVPKEELEEVKELVKTKMENVYKLSVPLKVEIEQGLNWYEA
ncbi:MAG: DNA polymerase I [Bacilli bacterium]|nr:DNA polymerase I [Bacilli bacterium]